MNIPPVTPLLRSAMVAALCALLCSVSTAALVLGALGRRSDVEAAPLPDALRAVAAMEALRLGSLLEQHQRLVDGVLQRTLEHARGGADPALAVLWIPGACSVAAPPLLVERTGVVDVVAHAPLVHLEFTAQGCVDRLGAQAVQALTGPPFPSRKDVEALAQLALPGLDNAVEGATHVVAQWRVGSEAHPRQARVREHQVAWADLNLARLLPPPALHGVEVHSLLMRGDWEVGYLHGGPRVAQLRNAVMEVKEGKARALDLPQVADELATQAVVARLYPEEDRGALALGAAAISVDSSVPGLAVWVVAACPHVGADTALRLRVLTATGLLLLTLLSLMLLVQHRLSTALRGTAADIRAAWLEVREDDAGSDAEAERAERLLTVLAERMEHILHAAFGRSERFWAPSPLNRLLTVLRARLRKLP